MPKKIITYRDPLHDDFANNNIQAKSIPADFPFALKGPGWAILEFLLYRLIATPLVWIIGKVGFGLRIKNRRVLRKLRKTGFYLYGNHTQNMMDAYTPTLCVFPHHAHIITSPDAVSIPLIRRIVQLLGAIPLPDTVKGFKRFFSALSLQISRKRVVTVYPEAHIWPWYTGIRPFPDGSFGYPVRQGVPVVAFVTTFRKRRVFQKLWPCLTVTLSEPFYPETTLSEREARRLLRNQVYEFMIQKASDPENYVYYEYRIAEAEK